MTSNEFVALCARYTIDPGIALENDNIVDLLLSIRNAADDISRNGYRNALIMALESEF